MCRGGCSDCLASSDTCQDMAARVGWEFGFTIYNLRRILALDGRQSPLQTKTEDFIKKTYLLLRLFPYFCIKLYTSYVPLPHSVLNWSQLLQ
jgi:hypothetical protein